MIRSLENSDPPIATRIVESSNGKALSVKLYAPERHRDDWGCRIVLQYEDGTVKAEKICEGIDGVQAIQVGFSFIRGELGEDFSWVGESAVLGFPASLPGVFGIDFYRDMQLLVSNAETQFVQSGKRKR